MKPKKTWLPITPVFNYRILFYNENRGVCKKLELNILKIFDFFLKFLEIILAEENFLGTLITNRVKKPNNIRPVVIHNVFLCWL